MQNAVEQLDPDHVLRSLLTDGDNMREMRSLMEELTSIYEKEKALLDLLPQYFTKENLALVGKLAKDADAAELTQLLGDTKLLSCANQLLDSSLIKNIQKLLIDVVALQSIDLEPLDQILSAAGNLDSFSGVLDSIQRVTEQARLLPGGASNPHRADGQQHGCRQAAQRGFFPA